MTKLQELEISALAAKNNLEICRQAVELAIEAEKKALREWLAADQLRLAEQIKDQIKMETR